MAVISGTGGAIGGTLPPPTGGTGGGNVPYIGGGYTPTSLAPLPNYVNPAPVTNIPDYGAILAQSMAPNEAAYAAQVSAFNAQMAALQEQAAHQRGFAEDAYGVNKESDQAAYDQYIKQLISTLVGRGLGKSGATNYYTRIRQQALQRQLALLKNSLDSYLYGLDSSVTNARLSGQAGLAANQAQLAAQRASLGAQLPSMYPATVTQTPRWPGL